ncbi:MAG: hypothetical protein M3R15_19710 [Acidobacteriota bacterium]|nr:hypothetical protein [Acidobacteriota bacterium]
MIIVFLAHVAATLFMTGVIWFVQVVHYPLFSQVGPATFINYESAHARLTTWIVAPPMLFEVVTGALLLWWRRPSGVSAWLVATGFALVLVIWLSTYFLQVPRHTMLGKGYDQTAHDMLVFSNWLRTIAWSARSVLVLWMAALALK